MQLDIQSWAVSWCTLALNQLDLRHLRSAWVLWQLQVEFVQRLRAKKAIIMTIDAQSCPQILEHLQKSLNVTIHDTRCACMTIRGLCCCTQPSVSPSSAALLLFGTGGYLEQPNSQLSANMHVELAVYR